MKTTLILFFAFFFAASAFAQKLPQFDNVSLSAKEDYGAADTIAYQAASYILATPFADADANRLQAERFLIKWMTGTPDYTFALGDDILKYFDNSPPLMAVYMAALAQTTLENKQMKDGNAMNALAVKKFIAYITNSNNQVKMTGKLRKMISAEKNGKLK